MADEDAVVVVVQVIPPQDVQVPPHGRHDVVNSPLQHGAAGQPLVLEMWWRRLEPTVGQGEGRQWCDSGKEASREEESNREDENED